MPPGAFTSSLADPAARQPRAMAEPFYREAGAGPGVVCLHSNAASSSQWRALMEGLAPTHHVLAPDSYGAGQSADWPSARTIALRDEVAFVEPVFQRAGAPMALVGHSYGAAVALIAALDRPERVGALVLYEPTLFALIDAESPAPNDADGIRAAVTASAAALDAGDADSAALHFIDYWMGAGAWARTPPQRKPAIAASVANVRRWSHALTTEPTPLAAFRSLDVPVLCMVGKRSPDSSRAVARLLVSALPKVQLQEFDGLGHMGPLTHPEPVNEAIVAFLAAHRPASTETAR